MGHFDDLKDFSSIIVDKELNEKGHLTDVCKSE